MNTKKTITALVLTAALAVPFTVFAAKSDAPAAKTVRGFFGIDTTKLSDQQKADMKDYFTKMADLRKEFINKMVANGTITKEQGDAEIKKIDEMAAKGGEIGFAPGFMKGKGGLNGAGKMGIQGKGQIDTSKLTDEQKAELANIHKKAVDSQKEYINKQVANGLLTQEQADNIIKKIDTLLNTAQSNIRPGIFMGGFHGFSIGRTDTSKLTEQQKADLDEFSKKMTEIQKEYVDKMVSFGLITAEQGNAMTNKPAMMEKRRIEKGDPSKMEDRKANFHKRKNMDAPKNDNTAPVQ